MADRLIGVTRPGGWLAAAVCMALAAGCGSSSTDARKAPLAVVRNPSPTFGAQLSRVCEGTDWQLRRYYNDRSRPGTDDTSIFAAAVVRLSQLRPPAREATALSQLSASLTDIENLVSNGPIINPIIVYVRGAGDVTVENEVVTASRAPIARVVALSKRLLAPGCTDVVLGLPWRKDTPTPRFK
jgi:hypothetical protein